MYAVCSGSEANDLALRVARANVPGAWHVAVMEGAYHGHTTATLDLSPYKFDGPGGLGKPPHVHVLPCPDVYRCALQSSCAVHCGSAKCTQEVTKVHYLEELNKSHLCCP